jgi:hypothetical protein
MAFKRKRSSGSSRPNKRRRTGRRRNKFGRLHGELSRRIAGVSGQAGTIGKQGFRTKRMSGRSWRGLLWRETQSKQHYRSCGSGSGTQVTQISPASVVVQNTQVIPANFWASPFVQVAEDGVTPPSFIGDLVIRGGKCSVSFCNIGNGDTGDAVRCKLWMVWTNSHPDATLLPTGAVPASWDPSLIPDFQRLGKIIGFREFWLLPGSIPMEVSYRLRTQKVDRVVHNNGGETIIFIFTLAGHNTGVDSVTEVTNFNLSFTGDIV